MAQFSILFVFFFIISILLNYHLAQCSAVGDKIKYDDSLPRKLSSNSRDEINSDSNPSLNDVYSDIIKYANEKSSQFPSEDNRVPDAANSDSNYLRSRFTRTTNSSLQTTNNSNISDNSSLSKLSFSSTVTLFATPSPGDDDDIIDNEKPVAAHKSFTKGAMIRGLIVFFGCFLLLILYFLAKFLWMTRRKRYKMVSHGDEMDMFPLNASDGEDDDEIFSASMN